MKWPDNTAVVVGIVERTGKGRVLAMLADDVTRKTLRGIAQEKILPESTVCTDSFNAYRRAPWATSTSKR